MIQLFSEAGLRRLNAIAHPGLLCVFDFDGTLAPIVAQPGDARLSPDTLERLRILALRAPIAILTGRAIQDITPRLGFEPDYLVGNHGIEGMQVEAPLKEYARLCATWMAELEAALPRLGPLGAHIQLEDKRYSLSVHYRQAPDTQEAIARLQELFAGLRPAPKVVGGKYVFNLLPSDGADKGVALCHLAEVSGAETVIYVGDDVTDEDAFRLRHENLMTVRIGQHADSHAQFFLEQREDMLLLLDALIERLPLRAKDPA